MNVHRQLKTCFRASSWIAAALVLVLVSAAAALADPGTASIDEVPRRLRVVLGDDTEIRGVGPARVETGTVLFRLDDGLLVSLPFRRVKMIVPAWQRALAELEAASRSARPGPAVLAATKREAPAGLEPIVITNADLPRIHRLMYSSPGPVVDEEGVVTVIDETGGVPQFDELYWRARARGVLDQLRDAVQRVRTASGHVSSLERFSSAVASRGEPLPLELEREIETARAELQQAETLRDELILEWEELKAVARDAGAEIGSL